MNFQVKMTVFHALFAENGNFFAQKSLSPANVKFLRRNFNAAGPKFAIFGCFSTDFGRFFTDIGRFFVIFGCFSTDFGRFSAIFASFARKIDPKSHNFTANPN
jgi:hypothetical protein